MSTSVKKKWWFIAFALMAVAYFLPESAIDRFSGWFGVEEPQTTPFDDQIARADNALQTDQNLELSRQELLDLRPQIQIRRLAANGPLAGDKIPELRKVLTAFHYGTLVRKPEFEARNHEVARLLRRWKLADVSEVLDTLDAQIARHEARFQTSEESCQECHFQTLDLPADHTGLWPLWKQEHQTGLPILSDTAEMQALAFWKHPERLGQGPFVDPEVRNILEKGCTDCHAAHGAPEFVVDLKARQANIGFWVETFKWDSSLYVQTKIQNLEAAHRVPGGWFKSAYVVVVEAQNLETGTKLKAFHGPALPEFLQTSELREGVFFGRLGLDAQGKPTTDPNNLAAITSDTRLEPRRFEDQEFIFELPENAPYKVIARVIYLPDYSGWSDAIDVEVRILP